MLRTRRSAMRDCTPKDDPMVKTHSRERIFQRMEKLDQRR